MADGEAPARLTDALEAFKADLSVNLRSSEAFAALKVSAVMRHSAAPFRLAEERHDVLDVETSRLCFRADMPEGADL